MSAGRGYTRLMQRIPRQHSWFVTLICVGVLFTHASGLHFHILSDGHQTERSILHLEDGGFHGPIETHSAAHHDHDGLIPSASCGVEVNPAGPALVKLFFDPISIASIAALMTLLPRVGQRLPTPRSFGAEHPIDPFILAPPLRGPPRALRFVV